MDDVDTMCPWPGCDHETPNPEDRDSREEALKLIRTLADHCIEVHDSPATAGMALVLFAAIYGDIPREDVMITMMLSWTSKDRKRPDPR